MEFDTNLKKMLHQIAVNTGIILADCKITNNSARRTAIMLLKASDTPEDELMAFSASLILFATIEKDLEEYYNYFGESYIIYKSEENNSNT
ncbi:12194_t:CDS:2, partial [Cetraspora pellucida]